MSHWHRMSTVLLSVLVGCVQISTERWSRGLDPDGDGLSAPDDCDNLWPVELAETPYDGRDNDCESVTPDDDLDGDGYPLAEDCDDDDPTVHPGAEELCDGQLNDCDATDAAEAEASAVPDDETDDDGDGYVPCEAPTAGLDAAGGDCHDGDPSVYPGADELCDGQFNDCEDESYSPTAPPLEESDQDADLYVACEHDPDLWARAELFTPVGGDDCDDTDPVVYPGAEELCDGRYNDCSDDAYTPLDAPDDERDDDGDGYVECADDDFDPRTWVGDTLPESGSDCDDADDEVFPSAEEQPCDGADSDCDGELGEWETDDDEDGYVECTLDDMTWKGDAGTNGDDCDDEDASVHPDAVEVCNDGTDDDCDELADDLDDDVDTSTGSVFYVDADSDRFGDADAPLAACKLPEGYVEDATDCDDDDASRYPVATEVCRDGVVNDCDGLLDDARERCLDKVEPSLSDTDQVVRLVGEASTDNAASVNALGDITGDGRPDFAVGALGAAPAREDGAGSVYLVYDYTALPTPSLDDANAEVMGEAEGDHLCGGAGIAIDDDSPLELWTVTCAPTSGVGSAYLFLDPPDGTVAVSTSDLAIDGNEVEFGGPVHVADLDEEGEDYLLFSDTTRSSDEYANAGIVYVAPVDSIRELLAVPADDRVDIDTLASATLEGSGYVAHAGHGLVPAGDVNGDGFADFLVGSPYFTWDSNDRPDSTDDEPQRGAAYVVFGPVTGNAYLYESGLRLWGESGGDGLGMTIANAGDGDGDGYSDLAISAPGRGSFKQQTVYVIGGGRLCAKDGVRCSEYENVTISDVADATLEETQSNGSGIALSGAGDVDADGLDDLMIGTPYRYDSSDYYQVPVGAAHVLLGPLSGASSLVEYEPRLTFTGENEYDYTGGGVASAGDLNDDGYPELLVGADGYGGKRGAAYLLLSPYLY